MYTVYSFEKIFPFSVQNKQSVAMATIEKNLMGEEGACAERFHSLKKLSPITRYSFNPNDVTAQYCHHGVLTVQFHMK